MLDHHRYPEPLIDSFNRRHSYLRISLTDRCNLRCTYCMPEQGIDWTPAPHLLQNDEIIRLAKIFVNLGIRKIRLTGGEPLLRKDLLTLVAQLARLDIDTLAMTTNGLMLARTAHQLQQVGLTSLTISLDSLRRERFEAITRRDRLQDTLSGITAALAAGFSPLKINCVVMRGINDDELLDFIAWADRRPIELRFIEYMPFPDNRWKSASVMPYREMIDIIQTRHKMTQEYGDVSAVGKTFALADSATKVSFISSMSESFCGSCNRLRLTADGQIKSCLFHEAERNLRDVMRTGESDEALCDIIRAAVWLKPEAHPPMEELLNVKNRSMIAIGG
jgi:cyclic pyranopterin phosphate synthase